MPLVQRPNILLCLFDSLSLADSGLSDNKQSLPALSTLRDKSAFFTNAYAPCPESSPARASLFTGLDPCVHGLWTNGVALPDTEKSVAHRLLQAGYTNWLVGRRQLAGMSNWTTEFIRAGEYTEVNWAHGPLHRSRQNVYLSWLQQQSPEHYKRIFRQQADATNTQLQADQITALSDLPDNLSFNHWVGERLIEHIDAHDTQQPFMAVAGFSIGNSFGAQPVHSFDGESVHTPALLQADTAIARLQKHLSAKHLNEDTLVLVTSGRGNWTADSTHCSDTATAHVLDERAIQVPLLIYRAGVERTVVNEPISTLDIAPTIIQLAGLDIGPRVQGRSLINAQGKAEAPRGWAMTRVRRNTSDSTRRCWISALRMKHMKLVVTHANPDAGTPAIYQLFNLDDDPQELNDLATSTDHAATLEDMIDKMIDARVALEDRTEPRIAEF